MKGFMCVIFCFLLIILPGCRSQELDSPENGYLEVTFLLDEEIGDVDSYDVEGVNEFGYGFMLTGAKDPTVTIDLEAGNWDIIAKAKNAADEVIGAGREKQVTVIFQKTVPIEIPITPTTTVTFVDENLEAAIREAISKSTGKILSCDLWQLTKFVANYKGIEDLSGIEYCEELKELNLERNRIVDIGPLSGLPNLSTLHLGWNRIENIETLPDLPRLTRLSLKGNKIKDISRLGGLTNLSYLNLENIQSEEMDVLPIVDVVSKLTNLSTLYLGGNGIENINELADLANLRHLYLNDNKIKEINALGSLTNLLSLYLQNNQLEDISILGNLTSLVYLDLGNNGIEKIDALSSLKNLKELNLSNNKISNISALRDLPNLLRLRLNDNPLDLSDSDTQGILAELKKNGCKVDL